MFRTMAHRPEIFETIIAHMEAVLNIGTLPKGPEGACDRAHLAAQPNYLLPGVAYCDCAKAGVDRRATKRTARCLGDVGVYGTGDAAIRLAEVMTLDAHRYGEAEFTRLRSFYTEGEIVELLAAIGLFNYFNRLNDLLQMEPTQPAGAEELAMAGIEAPASV